MQRKQAAVAAALVCASAAIEGCRASEPPSKSSSPNQESAAPPKLAAPVAPQVREKDVAPPLPKVESFAALEYGADEKTALSALGAMPLWDAVVARSALLHRRGASGIVFGRVRQARDALWIADESTGEGALAARLQVPRSMVLADNSRVVAWGAWQSPKVGVWAWQANRVALLSTAATPLAEPPGLLIRQAPVSNPLSLAELIASTKDKNQARKAPSDPQQIIFYIRRQPVKPGDPWEISDSPRASALAKLSLPGELSSYGGQDYRANSERWILEHGKPYWVVVGKIRPARDKEPLPHIIAASPPRYLSKK